LPSLPNGSIKVENVWKRFRADQTVPQFYEQMKRLTSSVKNRDENRYRWVLKDVNLDIAPGSTVALIGINGSGKTTLLKILSQVTYQTAGRCTVQGSIGALLSVAAGLHPDLTGRENVYLYGTVLGMSRQRIRERFDEIVEFAELSNAINRQVKFYSAGMLVRLGFSIAAFLEPDVLLVDEILAVGDANFQQKCLQRISEIVRGGTTLIYVSHDLASVEASCQEAVWLADAVVQASGPTRDVVKLYRQAIEQNAMVTTGSYGEYQLKSAEIAAADGGQIRTDCDLEIRFTLNAPRSAEGYFYVGISQGTAFPMFIVHHHADCPAGDFQIRCVLKNLPLPKGRFSVWAAMCGLQATPYIPWKPVISFDAFGPEAARPPEGVMAMTPIYVGADWRVD
jgi:ABC-type polysaccharide/polyol phosphate transport system ATPase subunit